MTLHLPKNKKFTIEAHDVTQPYIGTMKMNGRPYDRNYLVHTELIKGGSIVYQMQATPNRKRGISAQAQPYSFIKNNR